MAAANQRNAGASFQAVQFALKPSHTFVLSSLLAALGALLALHGMAWVFCLALALVLYLVALMLGCGRRGAAVLTLSFSLFFFLAQERLSGLIPAGDDLSQLRANVVCFSGRVESARIKDSDKGRLVTVMVCPDRLILPWSKALTGRVLVHVGPFGQKTDAVPRWGGKYVFSGRLIKPRARVFSFEFDERRWLALQNVFCQVSCTEGGVQSLGGDGIKSTLNSAGSPGAANLPNWLLSLTEGFAGQLVQESVKVREGIVHDHISVLGDQRGKLLTSMVLGDRAVSLSDEIKSAFNKIGLSHLLAASGLNLTIIVGAWVFLFGLGRNKNKKQAAAPVMQTLGALVCVLFFVSLAGASPSVTRATVMCLLMLWTSLVFRQLARGAALACALWLALVFDPLSILDVGLELSYGATFGIIYFYPMITDALPRCLNKRPWRWLCAICAVVMAAQLAVLPVQVYYFQKISTLVLPANVLAEPLVAPITVLGFASSLISALSIALSDWGSLFSPVAHILVQLSAVIDFFCGYLIDLLLWLTHTLGALPFSYLYLARPQAAAVAFYYLALLVAFLYGLSRPAWGAALALIAGLALTWHCFLISSCLEILVAREKVLIGRPVDPPVLLEIEQDYPATAGTSGFMPGFHRDFIQSYIRSLGGPACLSKRISSAHSCKVVPGKSGLILQQSDSLTGPNAIATISIKDGQPTLVSPMPADALETEEAQGVKLYKFKVWGLLAWMAGVR